MAVEMRLSGGLGNQLHQFAAGVAIAGSLRTTLNLNLTTVNLGSNANRKFELDCFDINDLRTDVKFTGKPYFWKVVVRKIASRYMLNLDQFLVKSNVSYAETSQSPREQISKISDGSIIGGHFATFEWVELAREYGFKPRIKKSLVGSEAISLSKEISSKDVAIHLRFGDFMANPDIFPVVSDEFVDRALKALNSFDRIWIFTDDLKSAYELCPRIMKRAFNIVPREKLNGIESFWLMGKFSKFITGNSTFSTWAAYLSEVENIEVVTPTPHLLNGWIDGLPKNWKRVPITQ